MTVEIKAIALFDLRNALVATQKGEPNWGGKRQSAKVAGSTSEPSVFHHRGGWKPLFSTTREKYFLYIPFLEQAIAAQNLVTNSMIPEATPPSSLGWIQDSNLGNLCSPPLAAAQFS